MISVYILPKGDVAYRCSVCDHTVTISIVLSESVFWDVYNGQILLNMIQHYKESHDATIRS
jgi:hypothetical protein